MKIIGGELCGGWIIVLFMVMSFIIGCVDRIGCVFSFSNHSSWLGCGFLTFPYLWGIHFSSQMIVELSVGYRIQV